MHFLYSIFLAGTLLCSSQQGVPYTKIGLAFEQKNPSGVVACAKEKILINIEGAEGAYSRSQAILVLKDFFDGACMGVFTYTFKGNASDVGTFAIGNYTCETINYRVTMHFKGAKENYQIEQITIEKN